MEIDNIVAVKGEAQIAMIETDAGGERIAQIALADLPAGIAGPKELRLMLAGKIGVNPKAARPRAGVVFLPDMGEIKIANLVLMVEGNEELSVPDRDITRHEKLFPIKPARIDLRRNPPGANNPP
jgi:hypothetical protein